MKIEVRNRPEHARFELVVDGEVAGKAEYRTAPGLRAFVHTEVDERLQGQGLAGRLVAEALSQTRTEGVAVEPFCRYVRRYIEKNDEFLDLVPDDKRSWFNLPTTTAAS